MKKTWLRLGTLFIALVLLAGLLPAAAAAEIIWIEKVDIDNVTWPTVGSHPQFYIDDSGFDWFTVDRDQYGIQYVEWFQEEPWQEMKPEDTFEYDTEYRMTIALKAKEGYLFDRKERFFGGQIGGREIFKYEQVAGGYYCRVTVKWYSRKPVHGGVQWTCNGRYDDLLSYNLTGDLAKLNRYQQRDDIKIDVQRSKDNKNWEHWRDFQIGDALYPDNTVLEH